MHEQVLLTCFISGGTKKKEVEEEKKRERDYTVLLSMIIWQKIPNMHVELLYFDIISVAQSSTFLSSFYFQLVN